MGIAIRTSTLMSSDARRRCPVEKKKPSKAHEEQVLQEWSPLGKYRIRLLANRKDPEGEPALDIREFIQAETFEGFTRRGIRLSGRAQLDLLRAVLTETLARTGLLKSPAESSAAQARSG
jgi:hypothetical protein